MRTLILALLLTATACAADCPTKPGKYELVQKCDTVLVPVGKDDSLRTVYGFRVDTTFEWAPIPEIVDTIWNPNILRLPTILDSLGIDL